MKKSITALLVVLLPALFFANVLQAYRYNQLEQTLEDLSVQQQSLLEENKRAILAISVLSSPERISELAIDELDLIRSLPTDIIHLSIPSLESGE